MKAIAIAVGVLVLATFVVTLSLQHSDAPTASDENTAVQIRDFRNTAYIVEGRNVTLKDGLSEVEGAPGSASKITTRYFGNEAKGDLNGDGKEDIAFILTQDSGGSGTFYYMVAALATDDGYAGTQAILLGDRIAPQTTEIRGGFIAVNYADRASGEPMTAAPTVGVSKRLMVKNGVLVDLVIP